jgi:hypothetical protein
MNIKDFAEKYIKAQTEAWFNGNFLPLAELEDPNIVIHAPPPTPDLVGHEAHKQDIINGRQFMSDYKFDWQFLAGEKNLLAFSLKINFKMAAASPNIPIPVGKKVFRHVIIVGLVNKGKFVESWVDGGSIVLD